MVDSAAVADLCQTTHPPITQPFSLLKLIAQPYSSRTNNLLVPPNTKSMAARQTHPILQFYPAVKQPGQLLAATNASGHNICRLLHVTDRISKRNFLVDTSAQVSIIPPTRSDRLRKMRKPHTLGCQRLNNCDIIWTMLINSLISVYAAHFAGFFLSLLTSANSSMVPIFSVILVS